jgi:hypothetical protein
VKKMGSRASGWTATTTPARMKANRVKMGSRASGFGLRHDNDDKGLGWSPTPGRFLGFVQHHRDRLMGAEMFSTMRRGRHVTRKGFESDARKYNRAVLLGWKVLRFTPSMIASGEAVRNIRDILRRPVPKAV